MLRTSLAVSKEAPNSVMRFCVSMSWAEARPATGARSAALAVAVEVNQLPRESCLVSAGEMRVYCAGADALPTALQEIGRLRRAKHSVGDQVAGDIQQRGQDDDGKQGQHEMSFSSTRLAGSDYIIRARVRR